MYEVRSREPLNLDEVIGQDVAVSVLRASLESGRLAHAYLFCGPSGTGKVTTAKAFARHLLCGGVEVGKARKPCGSCFSCRSLDQGRHPDFFLIGEDRKTIGIERSHQVIQDSMKKPFLSKTKVFVLRDVENMTREAANALLKVLEEPPPSSCFILTTSNAAGVPDTVLSRCQAVPFRPLTTQDLVRVILQRRDVEPGRALKAARLAAGSVDRALLLLDLLNGQAEMSVKLEQIRDRSPVTNAEECSRLDPDRQRQVLDGLAVQLESYLDVVLETEDAGGHGDCGGIFRYHDCLAEVAGARKRIERNVSPFLTFAVLFLRLRKLLREKGSE